WNCRNIHIKKNRLIRHRDGIYLEFAEDLNIEENESTESLRYGMHFMFSHKNVFLKNHFHHNPTGVAIMYSKGISVIENRFEKNWSLNSYGILLKDISDSRFAGNVFKDNTIGIYAEGSNRNRFSSNEISGNGWGISIFGNCDGNEFEKNNFNENVFDIITNSRKDENQFRNNYWSAYSGYDLNHDGTGDKIHFPVPVFAYWISKYPFLMVLFNSPLVQFLDAAEKAFPLLVPDNLIDPTPRMKPVKI
ncbi:MAG: right-handed parallel beta-helix repeat-containing protein, partial [Leptospira sp.]|nr:right-handed parallel beta-helix repeat-containing protein [Leptospira sp.]